MFKQQKQIEYPTNSALKNYYIESLLPAYVLNRKYNHKPLPKTHEFYKNDNFVWNNPYRASRKSYKYYHKQNDDYKVKQQKLKQEQLLSKQKAQKERINSLQAFRMEDRHRLLTRKSQRNQLQNSVYQKTFSTNAFSSQKQSRMRASHKNCGSQILYKQNQTEILADTLAKSVMLRQRQSRFQQLKDRRTQIDQLIKRSGQSLQITPRPKTGVKKPKILVFRQT